MAFWSGLLIQLFFAATVAAHGCPFLQELLHPPFLEDVNWQGEDEYNAIISNKSLSIAEQKKEIMSWAEQYNVTEQVNGFFNGTKKRMEDMKKNVTKLIEDLPAALQNFTGVLENENQTISEIKQSLKALRKENPPVYSVLRFIIKQTMPKHGPRPHGPKPRPDVDIWIFGFGQDDKSFPFGPKPWPSPFKPDDKSFPFGPKPRPHPKPRPFPIEPDDKSFPFGPKPRPLPFDDFMPEGFPWERRPFGGRFDGRPQGGQGGRWKRRIKVSVGFGGFRGRGRKPIDGSWPVYR